jgi:L-alanine-DL-glutamate epimerase-like enolase superfamily enzyme
MKIKDIQTTLLSVPLNPPIADSTHVLNHIQWIAVHVLTDEGLQGNSLMLTFDYGPELLRRIVDVELKNLLLGKDPQDISGIWQMCHSHCEYIGQTGVAMWGIAAIDIALWDLLGKQLGVPVCQLFGSNRAQVPVYGSGGWLSYSLDDLLAEVTSYIQRGFKMVKMKVGRSNIRQDVERVRAVREAIGDNIGLMVDANQAWTPQQALSFAVQVQELDLLWFEEPVAKDDLSGYSYVAAHTNIPHTKLCEHSATGCTAHRRAQPEHESGTFGRGMPPARSSSLLQGNRCAHSGGYQQWVVPRILFLAR